jgi:heme acquisition protein HasR
VNTTTGSNAYRLRRQRRTGHQGERGRRRASWSLSRKKIGACSRKASAAHCRRRGLDAVVHGISQLTDQDQSSALLKGTWRFAPGQHGQAELRGLRREVRREGAVRLGRRRRHDEPRAHRHPAGQLQLEAGRQTSSTSRPASTTPARSNEAFRAAGGLLDDNEYKLQLPDQHGGRHAAEHSRA